MREQIVDLPGVGLDLLGGGHAVVKLGLGWLDLGRRVRCGDDVGVVKVGCLASETAPDRALV
jgi:hypothetical protein